MSGIIARMSATGPAFGRRALILLNIALLAATPAVPAQQVSLRVQEPWARHVPGSDTAAVYFTVQNPGSQPATIVAVRSPAAKHCMMHETRSTGGTSQMRALERLSVPAGGTVRFAPEGMHVMLGALTGPLGVGDTVPVSLELADGQRLTFEARVQPLAP